MRNIVTIPFNTVDSLLIACDNSGAIGMKRDDLVQASYETLAYFSFRVAAMECIAAGGEPISVVLQNFCGDEPWEELQSGVKRGLSELQFDHVPITGSTESNFSLLQSALGVVVIGRRLGPLTVPSNLEEWKISVVGLPLVGNEVLEQEDQVAPLSMLREMRNLNDIIIWPVGSKGILHELNQIFPKRGLSAEKLVTNLDVLRSSGPATCFLAVYPHRQEEEVKKLAGHHFHPLQIIQK